ncbi:MAG: hypothetical protein MUE44_00685 [Oscillatoriaceae cyanobacterium Prado104]|nr:hypothetical protein [Oscillatoriaceae cyanobacterium Prado104]
MKAFAGGVRELAEVDGIGVGVVESVGDSSGRSSDISDSYDTAGGCRDAGWHRLRVKCLHELIDNNLL